jgi:hypothetical protein
MDGSDKILDDEDDDDDNDDDDDDDNDLLFKDKALSTK